MRYWLRTLTIAMLVAFTGILGCTHDSKPKEVTPKDIAKVEKDAKTRAADSRVPADKEKKPVPPDVIVKPPAVKNPEPGVLEVPGTDVPPVVVQDKKEPTVPDVPGKDVPPVVVQDKKEPGKDPKKDTGKEPKTPTEVTEVYGKSFAYWMGKQGLKSPDHGEREDAMKAVTLFGPNKSYEALPEIMAQMKKHTFNTPVDLSVRVHGIIAMSAIFRQTFNAKKEGPAKKDLEEALAIFRTSMKDDQAIMKVRALQGLPSLGAIARGAVDDVVKEANYRGTWEVRKEALVTLVALADLDNKGAAANVNIMKQLKFAVSDPAYYVRLTAVHGLAALAPGTGSVPIELRTKGIIDPNPDVRLAALQAIDGLRKELMNVTDKGIMIKSLNVHLEYEKNPALIIWTHTTIMRVRGKPDDIHMPPILKKLPEGVDVAVRGHALNAIMVFGEEAKPFALKSVLPLINDKEPAIAALALSVTVQMHHFPPVLAKLKEKATEVRLHALTLISNCGPPAKKECYEDVKDAISDKDIAIAEAAMITLVNMHAFEAIPYLRNIIADKSKNEMLRDAAKDAIEDLLKIQKESKEKK